MAHHPIGAVVAIFGIQEPVLGASCEHHSICGHVLQKDSIIRFEKKTFELGKSIFVQQVVDSKHTHALCSRRREQKIQESDGCTMGY